MSQRSGVGSTRGGEGSQRAFGGSQQGRGQPPSTASGSQRGAQGPPPVGTIQGPLYMYGIPHIASTVSSQLILATISRHPQDPSSTLDRKVLRLENEYESSPNLGSLSLAPERFPSRPGFGKRGKPVIIWANYFQLLVDPRLVFYQYNISIQPQVVGRKRARLIELFLQRPESVARSDSICSDFKSTLFSRGLLDDDYIACNIVYRSEFETEPGSHATAYQVRLEHVQTLPVRRLLEFIATTNLTTALDQKDALIQAFNVFLNHYAKSNANLVTFGNKTFPKDAAGRDLGGGLMAIRGFFSSVRAATGRILVNVNLCCSAFYRPGPLTGLIVAHGLQDKYRLEQFVEGVRVKTFHTGTARIRTIRALASPRDGQGSSQPRPKVAEFGAGPSQVQFWFQEQNRYVTVSEFFFRAHGIRSDNERLPVVNVGSKANPVYLLPQVCEVIVGQKAGVKLDAEQTSKMINYAVRRPATAHNALSIAQEGLAMVGMSRETNPLLDNFHIKVNPNFTSTPARLLPKPGVVYGNKRSATVSPAASWSLRGLTMSRPAKIPAKNWGWLYITMIGCPGAFPSERSFISALESLQTSLRKQGIEIGQASPGSQRLHLNNEEDPALEAKLRAAADKGLDLLLITMPAKNTALYSRIKYLCDVKFGIVNICTIGTKLVESNGQAQYFGNIGLKLNLKCGGVNHVVSLSHHPLISQGETMVMGADVTHPGPKSSSRAPSVAAMTANVHSDLGQFLATSRTQESRQEMIDDTDGMSKDLLSSWKTVGKHVNFPKNILKYRDGVSHGQVQMVIDYELPLLKKACAEMYDAVGQERPRITLVIVTKRHHTRFGPTKESDADGNGNCLAGTVTDRGITEAGQWEFWLQAHSAIQGGARPAHYLVVHDEIFRATGPAFGSTAADTLEDITQSLHYVFGRCSRAVSYCAPTYYADLACERGRLYINNLFDPSAHSDRASSVSDPEHEDDDQRRSRLQKLITPHPQVRGKMYYI